MIYELIQPSDPIHFQAESDRIAYFCALILGDGRAGIKRTDNAECESPFWAFHPDPIPIIETYLGGTIDNFGDQNCAEIAACFSSFAYGSLSEYRTFCEAVEAITDAENLKAFKALHEDKSRSSMSKWVLGAWQYAEYFKKRENELATSRNNNPLT